MPLCSPAHWLASVHHWALAELIMIYCAQLRDNNKNNSQLDDRLISSPRVRLLHKIESSLARSEFEFGPARTQLGPALL